jgi:hypothetical protein
LSATLSKSLIISRSFWLIVGLQMQATWRQQIMFSFFFFLFRTITLQFGLGFLQDRYPFSSTTILVVFNFTPRFLKSNFTSVIYVVCFLLGNSPASQFYMPTFRNTLTLPSYRYKRWLGLKMLEYFYGKRFGSKIDWAYWLRLFSSQTFSRINTPIFSNVVIFHTYPPMKMKQSECSETSAYTIQTPGYYPERSIQHSEHGESLKSRIIHLLKPTCSLSSPSSSFSFQSHLFFPFTVHSWYKPNSFQSQYILSQSQCVEI